MTIRGDLATYDQSFKLGMLLAVLEYHGAIQLPVGSKALLESNKEQLLALFTPAIQRMFEYGQRQEIEELLLSIGAIPHCIDEKEFELLLSGYSVECFFQTPYPGYVARQCEPCRVLC